MGKLKRISFTQQEKEFIDSLVKNAYVQGHQDGFSISGKQFNGISGMLNSVDFKEISKTASENYMVDHEDFFKQFYTIK